MIAESNNYVNKSKITKITVFNNYNQINCRNYQLIFFSNKDSEIIN